MDKTKNDLEEMTLAIEEMSKFPSTKPLIALFSSYANFESIRYRLDWKNANANINYHRFEANIDDPNLHLSFVFEVSNQTDNLILQIFKVKLEDKTSDHGTWFSILVWDLGYNALNHSERHNDNKGLRIILPIYDMYLPTTEGRWFFGFLDSLYKFSNNQENLDLNILPNYWNQKLEQT